MRKNFRQVTIVAMMTAAMALSACNKSNNETTTQNSSADSGSTAQASKNTTAAADKNDAIAMTITGAGASFPQPIYAKWSADYHQKTGGQVNYQSIGSSGGIKQIIAGTVDFGASDAPMTVEELAANNLIQFPTVIGGVVPVVNIKGIAAGALKLDGKTLADIYLGNIKTWNDPAISKLNPELSLPDAAITTVFRSDGSGTTFNFTDYLAKVSPDWQSKVGVDKSVNWPTAKQGAAGKGNEGVASYVARMNNSIGYVEYAFAKQNNMAHVALENAAGNIVQPSTESFAAAGDIDWSQQAGFYKVITNSETANAWPIAAATFILMNKTPKDAKQAAGVLTFFNWAFDEGDKEALALDYVPFSDTAVALFKDSWKQVVDSEGKPVFEPK
ncbi:phosphate ABC transporter substrate-binding protein PstS [Psychrobacter ciconiae]|uniref:phosphate ABC transporter substrate-binding protein PstS n=1 Tax=Psychrobacter ciconiae TaxID=1553449 RepID=UPI00191A7DF9|nr:phosphate ABC transporter substrate-binding protein PstS [Psychrobacter ciconiae]